MVTETASPLRAATSRQDDRWQYATSTIDAVRDDMVVLDIGGTTIKSGHLRAGRVGQGTSRFPTSTIRSGDPVQALAGLIRQHGEEHGLNVACAIVTVPGFIDRDFDRVLMSTNVPEIEGLHLASALSSELSMPVILERDCVLLLAGERAAGSAKGADEVAGFFFGTGIGGAMFSEGRPFRGAGWAMEIGHLRLPDSARMTSWDTRVETRASGCALAALAGQWRIQLDDVFTQGSGDPHRQARLLNIVDEQAWVVASAIPYLSPGAVVIGGGVLDMRGYPWQELVSRIRDYVQLPAPVPAVEIHRATLGWQAALHGALHFALARLPP